MGKLSDRSLPEKVEAAERAALLMMIRALVDTHPDLAQLLEAFDVYAEKVSAENLASRRPDQDVDVLQLAIELQREWIKRAATLRLKETVS